MAISRRFWYKSNSLKETAQVRNVIIFVADGLRPDSVNPTDAPTLFNLRQQGVNFLNSHSLFPTFTTPNASAIATGHYLGDTGDFSNTIFTGFPVPSANGGSVTPFIENNAVLADIDEKFPGGNFLDEQSLLAFARAQGYSTAAVGKLGPVLIQDVTQGNRVAGAVPPPATVIIDDTTGITGGVPLSADITKALKNAGLPTITPGRGANAPSGTNTTPGTLAPNTDQQKYFADTITKAILPSFQQKGQPFAMVYWSRDPDGTQHNQGDSLNTLTPGINGPTSKAAVKNVDNNLKQLLDYLQASGQADNTDIFVTADHGFSTISKSAIDSKGTQTTSYAASLSYPGVNPGFLPKGFVAIDIAQALNLPLFDPDTPTGPLVNGSLQYTSVNPVQGQLTRSGNGLIGGTGKVTNSKTDAKVVIAANGGSDLIYIPNNDPVVAQQVVNFLATQDYISGIFADTQTLGSIAGALPLSSIGLQGDAKTPVPSIIINFKTFSTDPSFPNRTQVEIADTGLQQGQGMHGSFGRGDTFNNMIAIGPDFKKGFVDTAPVSNADLTPTLAKILGFQIPSTGNLKGRSLDEAIVGGPATVASTSGTIQSDPAANGIKTILNYQQVGTTRYFDVAGFAGGTVGLQVPPTSSQTFSVPSASGSVQGLSFLGQAAFPAQTVTVGGTLVGGLSGITYDATKNQFYSISDDRGTPPNEPGQPPRFYTLNIDLSSGKLDKNKVAFTNVTPLRKSDGTTFAPLSTDTEAIALTNKGTVFISSEGQVNAPNQIRVNPFVNEFSLTSGQQVQSLPIPTKFLPDSPIGTNQLRGTYDNLAFESVALTPNQNTLITASENALFQDGPRGTATNGSRSRILKYNLATGLPGKEFLYNTDPVAVAPNPATGFATAGLVELLALDNTGNHLLALERSFSSGVPGTGNTIKLYEVNLEGATNIKNINSLKALSPAEFNNIQPAQKQLLLNFDQLNLPEGLDNVEGMTFGPTLADGRRSLVLVSDDNFNPGNLTSTPYQPRSFTQILAFALNLGTPATRSAQSVAIPDGRDILTGEAIQPASSGSADDLLAGGSGQLLGGSDSNFWGAAGNSFSLLTGIEDSFSVTPIVPDLQTGAIGLTVAANPILDAVSSKSNSDLGMISVMAPA